MSRSGINIVKEQHVIAVCPNDGKNFLIGPFVTVDDADKYATEHHKEWPLGGWIRTRLFFPGDEVWRKEMEKAY